MKAQEGDKNEEEYDQNSTDLKGDRVGLCVQRGMRKGFGKFRGCARVASSAELDLILRGHTRFTVVYPPDRMVPVAINTGGRILASESILLPMKMGLIRLHHVDIQIVPRGDHTVCMTATARLDQVRPGHR
jgi:hypothetical protein